MCTWHYSIPGSGLAELCLYPGGTWLYKTPIDSNGSFCSLMGSSYIDTDSDLHTKVLFFFISEQTQVTPWLPMLQCNNRLPSQHCQSGVTSCKTWRILNSLFGLFSVCESKAELVAMHGVYGFAWRENSIALYRVGVSSITIGGRVWHAALPRGGPLPLTTQ